VHHIENDQNQLNEYLKNLQFLVFDEADRILTEESFKPELEVILNALPKQRQTMLFSATMVSDYDQMLSKEQIYGSKSASIVEVGNTKEADEQFQLTVRGLDQRLSLVPDNVKEAYLVHVVTEAKLKKQQQCIIFTSTCKNCHFLAMLLQELEIEGGVTFIHSLLTQRRRLANIAKFKSSQARVLVATDVASRGLDIPDVQLVLNFDVPMNPRDYVHRVGRTARAGRGGTAVTLVTQYDIKLIQAAEEYIKVKLEKVEYPEKEVLDDISHLMKVMQVVRIKMNEQGMDEQFT
jgi:ATP-dependent RNA helicase DDX49/DBP8